MTHVYIEQVLSTTYASPLGLEAALAQRDLSQADLSRATGKSDAQVNRWVTKQVVPSVDNRALILRALNEPVENGSAKGPFFTATQIWGEV